MMLASGNSCFDFGRKRARPREHISSLRCLIGVAGPHRRPPTDNTAQTRKLTEHSMLTTETAVLTVPEAAAARRSIRRFRQEPIDRGGLERIFESLRPH